jgi:hypothetical protein
MTRSGQTIVAAFSLHPDVVQRLDRLAASLQLSRSACVDASLRYVLDNYIVMPADKLKSESHHA